MGPFTAKPTPRFVVATRDTLKKRKKKPRRAPGDVERIRAHIQDFNVRLHDPDAKEKVLSTDGTSGDRYVGASPGRPTAAT